MTCEICGRRFENDEEVITIEAGTREKNRLASLLPPYFYRQKGWVRAHVHCLEELDHNTNYPEKTAKELMQHLKQEFGQ